MSVKVVITDPDTGAEVASYVPLPGVDGIVAIDPPQDGRAYAIAVSPEGDPAPPTVPAPCPPPPVPWGPCSPSEPIGLRFPLLDTGFWSIVIQAPVQLQGSILTLTLRDRLTGEVVLTHDSTQAASDRLNCLMIEDAANGLFSLNSEASERAWRAPRGVFGRLSLKQTLIGDVMRRSSPKPGAPLEHLATLVLVVRAGT